MEITFTDPLYLVLLLIIPLFLIITLHSLKYKKKRAMRLANFEALKRISGEEKIYINLVIIILRIVIILSLVLSTAGMVIWHKGTSSNNNFILAIDASGSMLADDLKPNRLEAAKNAAILFADSITSKAEIAVVSFSGISEVDQRLTSNMFEVKSSIQNIQFKSIHGTAIGDAIKASLNVLSGDEKPGVIVLLTDGRENIVSQEELFNAVKLVKKNQIIIHTIGIGTEAGGNVPGIDMTSTIDENILAEISKLTGGDYFRAESEDKLKEAYKTIASLSYKANIPMNMRLPLLIISLALIFIEWGLLNTKFSSIP